MKYIVSVSKTYNHRGNHKHKESTHDLCKDNGDGEFEDNPINEEINWGGVLYGELEFDSSQIMSHISFELKSLDEINAEIDDTLSTLP